jgi:hypothetical protein
VRIYVALTGLTTNFLPASQHPILLTFTGLPQPVVVTFPVMRAGAEPKGVIVPTNIPDDPGAVAADLNPQFPHS